MVKIKSKNITAEQIEAVNRYLGYEGNSEVLTDYGYAFFYNQIQNGLDSCDADRYANLNTILGYDVGIVKFRILDNWLWTHNYDLMDFTGTEFQKGLLQIATKETKTKELDFSKWTDYGNNSYTYSYFENGKRYE